MINFNCYFLKVITKRPTSSSIHHVFCNFSPISAVANTVLIFSTLWTFISCIETYNANLLTAFIQQTNVNGYKLIHQKLIQDNSKMVILFKLCCWISCTIQCCNTFRIFGLGHIEVLYNYIVLLLNTQLS